MLSAAVAIGKGKIQPTYAGKPRPIQTLRYATQGRVETTDKAIEQASFIFLSQLKSSQSGITPPEEGMKKGSDTCRLCRQLCYDIQIRHGAEDTDAAARFAERDMILRERQYLRRALAQKPGVEITDPDTQVVYKVKLNPMMMSDSLNAFQKFEHTLSGDLSGAELNDEVSSEGMEKLEAIFHRKISTLDEATQARATAAFEQYRHCDHTNFPEHRVFIRDYCIQAFGHTCSIPLQEQHRQNGDIDRDVVCFETMDRSGQ
jgi:hypothetical protein